MTTYGILALYQLAGERFFNRRSFGVIGSEEEAHDIVAALENVARHLPFHESPVRAPGFECEPLTFEANDPIVVPAQVAFHDAAAWLMSVVEAHMKTIPRPAQWDDESDTNIYKLVNGKAVAS